MLFGYEWALTQSPAGAKQWVTINCKPEHMIPDAHQAGKSHPPMMTTADLALRFDPAYEKIARHFHQNPEAFANAFAHAWFKLTHRDLGPVSRYLGHLVPTEVLLWQDPIPASTSDQASVNAHDIALLKSKVLASGLTISQLVKTAWASASTFRGSDKRGGANGARLGLFPQCEWEVNQPEELAKILSALKSIAQEFNDAHANGTKISFADLIVLAGSAALEVAAKNAGHEVQIAFLPGRRDALQEQTDVASFAVLEPVADGFRNYVRSGLETHAAELLIDKAQLLNLSAPEMTVLIGGLRVLNANYGATQYGVFTHKKDTLSNDFFINLLDMGTQWKPSESIAGVLEGGIAVPEH